jgi:membrane-associated phospholipid phosphatase
MRRKSAVVLALALLGLAPSLSRAQESSFSYALSPWREAAFGGTAIALYGSSLYFLSIKPKPDQSALDPAAVPFFDRLYSSSYSSTLDNAATIALAGVALVPAALIPGRGGNELLTLGVMYAETLGLAYTLDESLKSLVTRYSPYAFGAPASAFSASGDINSSFPSLHTTLAFASALFAVTVFDELEPGSRWKPLVWASSLGLAATISVLRVASGDHFASDVVAGAALGAGLGYLVPLLHKKAGGGGLALSPGPGGILLSLRLE